MRAQLSVKTLALEAFIALFIVASLFFFAPRKPVSTGPFEIDRIAFDLTVANGERIPLVAWHPRGQAPRRALILYVPGLDGTATQSSVQAANLASHGFVVVACNDLADAQVDSLLDFSNDAATTRSIALIEAHVEAQAQRLITILDNLGNGPGSVLGSVDLERVGVLGFSMGGSAAAEAARQDRRFAAVFNVDGWLYGEAQEMSGGEAYFLLSSVDAFPSERDTRQRDHARHVILASSRRDQQAHLRRVREEDAAWAVIENTSHLDLTDNLFRFAPDQIFARRTLRTNAQRADIASAVTALELAFFETTLGNNRGALERERNQNRHNVRWINSTGALASMTASAAQ